jgi:hypothetical protein
MHRDAVGHLAWATTFHLPRRAQVGHIADAESKDELAPLFGESAQLAGPEEAARQDTRLLSDITKVPSPRQFPDADRH